MDDSPHSAVLRCKQASLDGSKAWQCSSISEERLCIEVSTHAQCTHNSLLEILADHVGEVGERLAKPRPLAKSRLDCGLRFARNGLAEVLVVGSGWQASRETRRESGCLSWMWLKGRLSTE